MAVFLITLSGCRQQSESDAESTEQHATLSEELLNSTEYELWETILGDFKDGVFRGVSFDDTKEKVQITETFELFEELPDQLGYTRDTEELETVDVYYHFAGDGGVDQIVVDVFLNGKDSADRLWEIASGYFVEEYGEPAELADTKRIWGGETRTVTVENVSSGLDNGLKIIFAPVDKTVLVKTAWLK